MKVKLTLANLLRLFDNLNSLGYDIKRVSQLVDRHERTVRDWRRGKYLIDARSYTTMVTALDLSENYYNPTYVNEKDQRSEAGKIGGRAQWQKNERIGTTEDKIKGGVNSYNSRKNQNDIFSRSKIRKPRKSNKLAEFIGICMGDGSLTDYQLVISFNSVDDAKYVFIVKQMIYDLFAINARVQNRKDSKRTNLVVSSIELVEYLQHLGMPKGDKLRAGLDMPDWIIRKIDWSMACIRGLVDTDGSIFLEVHNKRDIPYTYPRLLFVSASAQLRESVSSELGKNGIASKIRMGRGVNIERFTDIEKYFRIVGSSNPKHIKRYVEFGGVG